MVSAESINEVINSGKKSFAAELPINTPGFFLTSTHLLRRFIISEIMANRLFSQNKLCMLLAKQLMVNAL
jgi:hypothetical protein